MSLFYSFSKFLIVFAFLHEINAEYNCSAVGLEHLLNMEENFITAVENYISDVQKIQKEIESFLNETEFEHNKMNQNENYYGEPINAFSLIKRFVVDWKHYEELIALEKEFNDFNKSFTKLESKYSKPTVKDLQGAAWALSRLQTLYQLDTNELARVYRINYKNSENLTAHDCYIMGVGLYNSSEFLSASEWFLQALLQLADVNPMDSFPFVSYINILEYLHVALFNAGNFKLAKYMNLQLLHFDPENPIALTNSELFAKAVVEERRQRTINYRPKVLPVLKGSKMIL